MMNKAEFESRVRQLAQAKTDRIRKRNKIIKTVSTIAGGVATAACIVLVMSRMNGKLMSSDGLSGGIMNSMGADAMSPDKEMSNNKFDCEDEMIPTMDEIPDDGSNGTGDKNDADAEGEGTGEANLGEMSFTLFSEVYSTPETVVLTTYPDSGDEGQKLSKESINLVMEWIRTLDLTDTGMKDNDKNGVGYMFELNYPDVVREVYVFDNIIKADNGTWYEFTGADKDEFNELIQDIRE